MSSPTASAATANDKRRAVSAEIGSLFCRNSSLRGVSKISRSDSLFLRSLWFSFVLVMFVMLLYSSVMVIGNYRDYDVAIQSSIMLNNLTRFPAVTICSHYPFSMKAMELWKKGLSPQAFNTMLRNLTRDLLESGRLQLAQKLTFYDKMRVYYQNLSPDMAIAMGRSMNEFLLHCMTVRGSYSLVGKDQECGLEFDLVSNPRYFNCYTVRPKLDYYSRRVSDVYLIVDLGLPPDLHSWDQAFVMDIFDQAFGLRLLLHEDGVLPNVDKGGVHIEPGKMVEIAFDTVQWSEATDLPNDRCHQGHQPYIYDLGRNYSYSYRTCIDQELNRHVINRCGCVLARLPRPVARPTPQIPYCGNIDPNNTESFFRRLNCLNGVDVRAIRQAADGDRCRKRCTRYSYTQQSSVTRWRATNFQLHWMIDQSQSWARLLHARAHKDAATAAKMESKIMAYLNSTNLREIPEGQRSLVPTGYNQFAYIIVRRRSFDSVQKREKLTVTFEALMSRIGGLCSLYLGLTMAFLVELVEFLYLALDYLRSGGCGRRPTAESVPLTESKSVLK